LGEYLGFSIWDSAYQQCVDIAEEQDYEYRCNAKEESFMKTTLSLCGALVLAMPGLLVATDYPLAFKTLDAQQAVSFPSGSLTYAMIQAGKPAGIHKAPPAISQHPLYGQIAAGPNQLLFRLDESKGNGKGYDRLIVDVNQNGDLTDDPVVSPVPPAGGSAAVSTLQQFLFGPIRAPENLKIGADRPVFFAQVYLFMTPGASIVSSPAATVGEMIVRPGWYLEATVNVNGKQHKVDLVDANCNFRLGDLDRPVTYRTGLNGNEDYWLFQGGDRFVVDREGATGVQSAIFDDKSCSFGPILYLDAKPYKATLAADCQSLSLDPWTEPLAELALQHGEQISSLQLAWEKTPGNWTLIEPGIENSKASVPPGNYRLYSAALKAKTASGEFLVMTGTKRVPAGGIKAVAGVTTPLPCGSPLQVSLSCQSSSALGTVSSGVLSALAQAFRGQSASEQTIQASILGAGGETYSVPYLIGNKGLRTPPEPTFSVLTADGKQVDSGTLEYG
jgi:hypothetical protein